MNLIQHFVNGKVFKSSSKRTSRVFNPATGEQTSEVSLASKDDVDVVVQKAKAAFIDSVSYTQLTLPTSDLV